MTIFQLAILTLISTTSRTITVTYLGGVQRLSNQDLQDHYFSCNTMGLSLIWEVNETVVSGFRSRDVGKVVFGAPSGTASIYNHTATLLSSIPRNGGQFTLDSVLIVSLPRYFLLNVICRTGTSFNSTVNGADKMDVINKSSINSVSEEYVFTKVIVTDSFFNHTSIFICGVENAVMYWRTGTNDEFGFSYSDRVGLPRGNLESSDTTVTRQAILIAQEPYRIVSVLFVTDTSDVTVTCGYPHNEVHLTSRCQLPSSSVDQTEPQGSTSNTSSKLSLHIWQLAFHPGYGLVMMSSGD